MGSISLAMFAVWTVLILTVDVRPLGQNGTSIGFATFNCWFHHFTGVNMAIYTITDWMGLVPVVICFIFAGILIITRHWMIYTKTGPEEGSVIAYVYYKIAFVGHDEEVPGYQALSDILHQ